MNAHAHPCESTLDSLVAALRGETEPRPIAAILADIERVDAEWTRYERLCQSAEVGSWMERSFGNLASEADDRLAVLRNEARHAIEAACGVTLAQIEGASL